MRAYCFFSVHIELFDRVAQELVDTGDVSSVSGFAWGRHVTDRMRRSSVPYDWQNVVSFSRDVLPAVRDEKLDHDWLTRRERDLGISLRRAIAAERHLLEGRTYEDVLRLVQVALRVIDETLERAEPDFIFSEDLSCLMSTLHWAVARERGIPFWCVGSARLPNRLSVYRSGFQVWERALARYEELETMTAEQRQLATDILLGFRERPVRPTGMETRSRVPSIQTRDVVQLAATGRHWARDPEDPTTTSPVRAVIQRVTRLARIRGAAHAGLFEPPVHGERYVLYPIHFQPEASTLVQAPMFLDQAALIEDIARSLPVGVRLYVKEHLSNRGRRPLSFYQRIRAVCGVRLLGPDENTWELIQNASAIAVITGTMGWEGLIFEKPVIMFGDAFYGALPAVYRALDVPKDRWFDLFSEAIDNPRADWESLVRFVVALWETSFPGFMKNPNTFPKVLQQDNVQAIAAAVRTVIDEPLPTLCRAHHVRPLRR